jgi:hypothetical protein
MKERMKKPHLTRVVLVTRMMVTAASMTRSQRYGLGGKKRS